MFYKTLFKLHFPVKCIGLLLLVLLCVRETKAQNFYYGNSFIDTTNSKYSGSSKNTSIIDSLQLNRDPSLQLQITVNYGTGTNYEPYIYGVLYKSINWYVFNEAGILDTVPGGLFFNVLVPSANGSTILQLADSTNISGSSCRINNTLINNNPNALLFVTHDYDPSESEAYENINIAPLGVSYDGQYWNIIDEDQSLFPPNTIYNVFVANASSNAFIQTTDGSNTTGYSTFINNTSIADSNKVLIVTQNYGTGVYNPHPIGVKYTGSGWDIFNLDAAAMPLGASFNVIVSGDSIITIPSGINSLAAEAAQFNVFPNPAQNETNITYSLTNSSEVTFKLLNSTGLVVKETQCGKAGAGAQQFKDDISQLPNGFYVYEMVTSSDVIYKKIIIIH